MAFGFDQQIDTLKDDLANSPLGQFFGFSGDKSNLQDPIYKLADDLGVLDENVWTYTGQDWYKIFGYQFVISYSENQNNPLIYTLPIPPQSLQIRMIPASQATPTIGGVVEETGENVFWLINMSGTTGIAVSRASTKADKRKTMAKQFREVVSTTGLLSGTLAGIQAAVSKIGGAADALVDTGKALADGNIPGVTSGLVGAFNDTFLPPLPYAASAVSQDTNGYTEMQELHRFLYVYSKLKAKAPSKFGLSFRCYKTNQQWECIVQDFNIQQSASNPMLYRYTISLKGWNVTEAGKPGNDDQFDRFAPGGDLQSVNLVTPEVFNAVKNNIFKKI